MGLAENLLSDILNRPDDPDTGKKANDLLAEIFRGYPVESLKALLVDPRESVVSVGIWITTELGYRCVPLLNEALPLLWSESKKIRFWAVETLLWASPDRAADLIRGLELLVDPESSVRWKATDFAVRASEIQLLSTLPSLEDESGDPRFADGVHLLLNNSSSAFTQTLAALESAEPITVRFGLISAVRRREEHPDLLKLAVSRRDLEEIQEIAGEWTRKN